jgi:hypothetical protein
LWSASEFIRAFHGSQLLYFLRSPPRWGLNLAIDFKANLDSDFRRRTLPLLVEEIIFNSDETIGSLIPPFCVIPRKSRSDRIAGDLE